MYCLIVCVMMVVTDRCSILLPALATFYLRHASVNLNLQYELIVWYVMWCEDQ